MNGGVRFSTSIASDWNSVTTGDRRTAGLNRPRRRRSVLGVARPLELAPPRVFSGSLMQSASSAGSREGGKWYISTSVDHADRHRRSDRDRLPEFGSHPKASRGGATR